MQQFSNHKAPATAGAFYINLFFHITLTTFAKAIRHYDTLTKYNLNAIIYSLNLSLARAYFCELFKRKGNYYETTEIRTRSTLQKYRFKLLSVSDFDQIFFKYQPSYKYQYVGLLFND